MDPPLATSLAEDVVTGAVTITQGSGATVTFASSAGTYSAPRRVVAGLVKNADGTFTFTRQARELLTFDSAGKLVAVRDLNGAATTMAYVAGRLSTVTDAAGRTLTLAYQGTHISTVTDTATPPRSVTFSYDGAGNLTDVVDIGGGHSTFGYDASHRLVTKRAPKYFGDTTTTPVPVTTNHYDAQGRVDWQSDPLGRTTGFDYDTVPGATKITDPKGKATLDAYQYGLLVARTDGYGTSQAATWSFSRDPDTLAPTAVVDPMGRVITSTYDAAGNRLSLTDALGWTTTWTYNSLNLPLTMTDPNQVTTAWTYDPDGNSLSESTPLVGSNPPVARTTTSAYSDPLNPGDVTSVTDADAKVWTKGYDTYGDLASVVDPLGNTTRLCYDGVGRATAIIAPKGAAAGVTCATPAPIYTTILTSNANGDPLTVTDSLGHQARRTYDLNRNAATVVDANTLTTTYVYDPAGQLTQVIRADTPATSLRNEYWPDGTLQYSYDGAGQRTSYAYDSVGRVAMTTDPLGRSTTFGYDLAGNQVTKQDPGGGCGGTPRTGCTSKTFDAANRVVTIDYSDPTTPDVSSIVYDSIGLRTSMSDGTGTSSWAWDSLGRLTSQTNGANQTVGYGHDLRDNLTSITYPGSTGTVTRTYDDAGRLSGVRDWLAHETVFNHDADSFVTSQVYPNGTTATYTPDAADRLMGVSHAPTAAPASAFAAFTYGRDNADQLTSVSAIGVPTDNHTYGYTNLAQLKTDNGSSSGYDAADNLTSMVGGPRQEFDAANQVLTSAPNAISLVGSAKAGNSTANSLTIALPTGTAPGDQILVSATLAYGKSVTTPTGYTVVGTYISGTLSTSAKVVVFRRAAVIGDTAVTLGFGQKYDKAATVVVYRGVSALNPIDSIQNSPQDNATRTSVVVPQVSPAVPNERLVMFEGAASAPSAGVWTPPTGMTEQAEQVGGTSVAAAVSDQTLTASGPSGSRTASFSVSSRLVGVLVALRPAQSFTYSFDTRGNRVQVNPGTAPTTLAYNQANRLTGSGTAATYAYNGDGLRTSKTVSGSTSAFTWAAADGLPQLLVDAGTSYVYGPGGLPLERISADGTVRYYHHDQLGSTRALTDAAGAVVATYTYDAYGKTTGSTGAVPNPFGFAGQYGDTETGFQYLRTRYYDPATGQFLTRDPIEAVTRAPYQYVSNNPINAVDPSGLDRIIHYTAAGQPANMSDTDYASYLTVVCQMNNGGKGQYISDPKPMSGR